MVKGSYKLILSKANLNPFLNNFRKLKFQGKFNKHFNKVLGNFESEIENVKIKLEKLYGEISEVSNKALLSNE